MVIKPTHKKVDLDQFNIPEGFNLVVDTREQSALFTRPPKGLYIVRDTLGAGDYSVRGFEGSVAVERKGLSDFYGSIGGGRDRFKRELAKLREYHWAGLAIEATEDQVLSAGGFYTTLTTEQIRQTLASIETRYRLSVYYAKDKKAAERWVLDRLIRYFIHMRKGTIP